MLIEDIITQEERELEESATPVWARRGGKLRRMYRCASGKRAGRIVASPAQCSAPIDMAKRRVLKRTRATMGARMNRKAQRVKKFDPVSRQVRRLNRKRT